MSGYGGSCKCKTPWNAVSAVAQIFLRTTLFTKSLAIAYSRLNDAGMELNLICLYLDLYSQLQMKEPKLNINSLVHHFLKNQPPGPVDLFDHLRDLLFELDAPLERKNPFSTSFMSSDGSDKLPFLRLERGNSIAHSVDSFVKQRRGLRLSRVLFLDVRELQCQYEPHL